MRITVKLAFAKQLIARLERLSADSYYAHQASGIRGSLLREVARMEAVIDKNAPLPTSSERLDALIDKGFHILEKAAQEL